MYASLGLGCFGSLLQAAVSRHAQQAMVAHQGDVGLRQALLLCCVVCRSAIAANSGHLHLLANEDTSVGLWMLAANMTFFEDMRLCSPRCT